MATESLPQTMRAIVTTSNKAKVNPKTPLPTLRPTYVLIKVHSIALNPTDWKHVSNKLGASAGSISGCDYAGTVVQVGDKVTKSLKIGDRVAGLAHGCNFSEPQDGAFAEYAIVKGDVLLKIPESMSFEAAATLGVGVATVGQGLYQKALKLNLPDDPVRGNVPVLIYGGSTATGSLAIQFAKLSGYQVHTTCSPHNFDFVTSLGADAVYDYRAPDCGRKINEATNNKLKLAWDTISLPASASICAEALSSDHQGVKYGTILSVKLPGRENDVETTHTLAYTIFNEAFTKRGRATPAIPEDFEFARHFFAISERLLADGKIKNHPELVREKGLEGALAGMEDMKNDKVSGKKLVYRVEETPVGSEAEVEL